MRNRHGNKKRLPRWAIGLILLVGVWAGATIRWRQLTDQTHQPAAPTTTRRPDTTQPDDQQAVTDQTDPRSSFLQLMNLGKAHLETADYDEAIKTFELVLRLQPNCIEAQRNLARANLFSDKPEIALQLLQEQREHQPDSIAGDYLTGVALARLSRHNDAIPYLEQAARADPNTAAIRYQLAVAYDTVGQRDKTAQQLQETLRLDPQHSAALYRLAIHTRNQGNMDQWRQYLREFTRLRDLYGEPTGQSIASEACFYTKAEPPNIGPMTDQATAPPIDVQFTDVTDKVFDVPADRSAAALAMIDMDENGRYTFLVVGPDGSLSLLTFAPDGACLRKRLSLRLPEPGIIRDCVVGNFYDETAEASHDTGSVDGLFADVMIIGQRDAHLLLRTGPEQFRDITHSAGLAGLTGRAARWVDYEYDGDLDLVVARQTGLQLWQNNGNGTLSDVTAEVGMANSLDCVDVEAADLDANGAVDFIVAQGTKPTAVFQNQRAGRLAPMPEPPGPWPHAEHILANDINNDGHPDTAILGEEQVTFLPNQGSAGSSIDVSGWDLQAATLVDYDNDGWLDFCAVGHSPTQPDRGQVRLWRSDQANAWTDVTADCGLEAVSLPSLSDLVSADMDADGDTDLLLRTANHQLRLLRNEGGHVNGQLKVRLLSLLIGNRGGIGAQIEVRDRDYWVTRWVQREWPVEIGLNGRTRLDAVRTIWPDGIIRNQTKITSTHTPLDFIVTEFIATGSCPYLYAWDGDGYRFVTDLLGGGALGVPVSRKELEPVDPRELIVIGEADRFRPNGESYTIKISNEQREADYLDTCRLLAVDHPRRVEVHSSSMLGASPKLATRVRAITNLQRPLRVAGDDGIDRTAQVDMLDQIFAPPGHILPAPLRGICQPLSLTLDFGSIPTDRPLVLALTGWVQYGTSSSNIALSQNPSISVVRPTLEAETVDGTWQELDVDLGLPAGKTKTILCDIGGKLPPNSNRLRLTTTYEVRWDRIVLCEPCELDSARVHDVQFNRADIQWRGFSEIRSRAEGLPTTPEFDIVGNRPPWRTALEGWYTRYGDVRPLLADADGQVVLLNGGDVLTLHAPAAGLPAVPRNLTRTFLLDSVGWNKEGDPNTVGGDRVLPLPGDASTGTHASEMAEPQHDWRLRYNTRWVARDHFRPARSGSDRREKVGTKTAKGEGRTSNIERRTVNSEQ